MVKFFSFLYFITFFLLNETVYAQSTITSVTQLPDKVNSKAEEIMPLISNSGDTLFFSRVFHESNTGGMYSGADIWYSTYNSSGKEWNAPSNNLQWNDKRNNFIVGQSWDRSIIYLNHPKRPDKGFQFVKYLSGKWTDPETIALTGINSDGYRGLYVSPDYEVILISMQADNSLGKEDLYVILKDEKGNWKYPVNLGSTINTRESEISPFISEDKSKLYFASEGHGGMGGMDIFMSQRLYGSWNVWSKPINLGSKINSEAFDGYYSQYGDTLAFFSSNRSGELADIFEVKMQLPLVRSGSGRIMQVASSDEINAREYLTQEKINNIFGYKVTPSIELNETAVIRDNQIAEEVIWFLGNKFKENPEIKLAIKVFALKDMSSEKMVIKSSEIAKQIADSFRNSGVGENKIQYDGVSIGNLNQEKDAAFLVKFSFFK